MFILHVSIVVKAGQEETLAGIFRGAFKAAISAQDGFRHVQLLRPDEAGPYVLSIGFENQALQQKWVATEVHGKLWPEMEKNFDSYSLKTFTAV